MLCHFCCHFLNFSFIVLSSVVPHLFPPCLISFSHLYLFIYFYLFIFFFFAILSSSSFFFYTFFFFILILSILFHFPFFSFLSFTTTSFPLFSSTSSSPADPGEEPCVWLVQFRRELLTLTDECWRCGFERLWEKSSVKDNAVGIIYIYIYIYIYVCVCVCVCGRGSFSKIKWILPMELGNRKYNLHLPHFSRKSIVKGPF